MYLSKHQTKVSEYVFSILFFYFPVFSVLDSPTLVFNSPSPGTESFFSLCLS